METNAGRSAADVELHAAERWPQVSFLPSNTIFNRCSPRRGVYSNNCEWPRDFGRCKRTPLCRLNHCVRSANDLPRRGAMDQGRLRRFRSQLVSRAGRLAHYRSSNSPAWSSSNTPHLNERQMDNIMYLYEQPGPPDDAPKATAAAEDGGLGG